MSDINGAVLNGQTLFEKSDTGWQNVEVSGSSLNASSLQQRLINGILYISGSINIFGNNTKLDQYGVKIETNWNLPTASTDTNLRTSQALISSTADENGDVAKVFYNLQNSVNNGYLLTFASTKLSTDSGATGSGNSVNAVVNLAIPLDFKTTGGGQRNRLSHMGYSYFDRIEVAV